MKRVWRILLVLVILLAIVIGGAYVYVTTFLPNVTAPDITVEVTPDRLERGAYLFNYGAGCVDCHSQRKDDLFGHPLRPGTAGMGGHTWQLPVGTFHAPNITPAALGDWSDGEIYRAIVSGVSKNGDALFPLMPWPRYAKMSKEDVLSIIAYMKTLPPIENEVPESSIDFPVNLMVNLMPALPDHQPMPDKDDLVAYGEYVVNLSACSDCHTPMDDRGQYIDELYMSGGNPFPQPTGGAAISMNITPHPNGIGDMSEAEFVHLFKMYSDSAYVHKSVGHGDFNSEMPWLYYAELDTLDIRAMYAYLMSLQPVDTKHDRFDPEWTAAK